MRASPTARGRLSQRTTSSSPKPTRRTLPLSRESGSRPARDRSGRRYCSAPGPRAQGADCRADCRAVPQRVVTSPSPCGFRAHGVVCKTAGYAYGGSNPPPHPGILSLWSGTSAARALRLFSRHDPRRPVIPGAHWAQPRGWGPGSRSDPSIAPEMRSRRTARRPGDCQCLEPIRAEDQRLLLATCRGRRRPSREVRPCRLRKPGSPR